MARLCPEKRARICTLLREGYSTLSIASCEGVSNVTVWKTGKHKDDDRGYKDLPHPGCCTGGPLDNDMVDLEGKLIEYDS